MNTSFETKKSTKPTLEYPTVPTNTKVMYLRDKNKTPIGCIVYQEMQHDEKVLLNYGYSTLARSDKKTRSNKKISPNSKVGRSFAIKRMFDGLSMELTPTSSEVRETRSGRFLLKEAVLQAFLDKKVGTESFRAKVKKHMKYAVQRAKEAEKTLEVKIPTFIPTML